MALPNPPSITVSPAAAQSAGCAALATVNQNYTDGTNWWQTYIFTATAAQGWHFEKFTWDLIEKNQDGTIISSETGITATSNPSSGMGEQREYYVLIDDNPIQSAELRIYNLTAHFVQDAPTTYTITTAVSPSGAGTTTGDGTYNSGTTATLTATANSGFQFLRWELNGTTVSTSATYSVTVSANATYTAVFEATVQTYHVQVVAFKSQAHVSLNGQPGDDTQPTWTVAGGYFPSGTTITIGATTLDQALYPFKAWYRNPSAWDNPEQTGTLVPGAGATYTTTVTADVVYFATFDDLRMTLEVDTYSEHGPNLHAPDAVVSINAQSDNDNNFRAFVVRGSTVVVGATAYGGLEDPQAWPVPMYFVGWLKYPDYNTILSDGLQYTFQTSQSDYYLHYIAKYATHYTLNTSVRPVASAGTVAPSPLSRWGNNLYPEYSNVTLTAAPNPGWKFKHWIEKDRWSEVVVSSAITYTVEITENLYYDTVYIAVFEWDGTDLLVNSSNLGSPVKLVYDDTSGGTGLLIADY